MLTQEDLSTLWSKVTGTNPAVIIAALVLFRDAVRLLGAALAGYKLVLETRRLRRQEREATSQPTPAGDRRSAIYVPTNSEVREIIALHSEDDLRARLLREMLEHLRAKTLTIYGPMAWCGLLLLRGISIAVLILWMVGVIR